MPRTGRTATWVTLGVLLLHAAPAAALMDLSFRDLDVGELGVFWEVSAGGAGTVGTGSIDSTGNFSVPVAVDSIGTVTLSGTYVAEIVSGDLRAGIENLSLDDGGLSLDFAQFIIASTVQAGPTALLDIPETAASDTTTVLFDATPFPAQINLFGARNVFTCLPTNRCRRVDLGFPQLFAVPRGSSGATVDFRPQVAALLNFIGNTNTLTLIEGVDTYTATGLITNPEPSTALLLGGGLLGLLGVVRRGGARRVQR